MVKVKQNVVSMDVSFTQGSGRSIPHSNSIKLGTDSLESLGALQFLLKEFELEEPTHTSKQKRYISDRYGNTKFTSYQKAWMRYSGKVELISNFNFIFQWDKWDMFIKSYRAVLAKVANRNSFRINPNYFKSFWNLCPNQSEKSVQSHLLKIAWKLIQINPDSVWSKPKEFGFGLIRSHSDWFGLSRINFQAIFNKWDWKLFSDWFGWA